MSFMHIQRRCAGFFFLIFVLLPFFTTARSSQEILDEKRMRVAMRMIGHEVLKCLGDGESRVLPIEKLDEHYRIPFEFEFGFDPDDIISIIDGVMTENEIASSYLVEVEQCETKEVVHSFAIIDTGKSGMVPCGGRILPKDCYNLLISILKDAELDDNVSEMASESSSLFSSETQSKDSFRFTFVLVPLLILLGITFYLFKKKDTAHEDPNLLRIGALQFDKRNQALFFENKSIELSNKEAELLSLLHTSVNVAVEREVILHQVWGDEGDYVGRTLDVFISKLRKKLEADTSVKIVNIRGVGYKLVMNPPL